MQYRFHDDARNDYRDAVSFYELQQQNLSREFVTEFEATLSRIMVDPESYAAVDDEIRSLSLRRFPYTINYAVDNDEVVVVLIVHHSRRPRYWRGRWRS